jgi:membrane protein YqaA with SNARE-associated domain
MNFLAFFWGWAEATLFFLVPDVALSVAAVRSTRAALVACGYSLLGALLGGTMMYVWGWADPASATAALDSVPGIGQEMIAGVEQSLSQKGLGALLVGPLAGIPYKIYAVQAGSLKLSFLLFALVSLPARLIRFLAVVLLVAGISQRLLRGWPTGKKYVLLTICWVAFYALYFAVVTS